MGSVYYGVFFSVQYVYRFMQLIRGIHQLHRLASPCVVTIGNFDGLHLGHQAVIRQLKARAAALGLPAVVMIFEAQPREYFCRAMLESGKAKPGDIDVPARLFRLRDKLRGLKALGVDAVAVLSFNQRLASLSAEDFIQRVLVDGLQARHVVIGDDFRFGARRAGDFALLKSMGESLAESGRGFGVEATESFVLDAERVSSTRVRAALAAGEMATAERLLATPYIISGRVARGRRLGRQLGFPTANIPLKRVNSPLRGIFAVQLRRVTGGAEGPVCGPWMDAVASVGVNPTVGALPQVQLEVHVFDFDGDLYGAHVDVAMRMKIRDEANFDSLDELIEWIGRDCQIAREFFARQPRQAASIAAPSGR